MENNALFGLHLNVKKRKVIVSDKNEGWYAANNVSFAKVLLKITAPDGVIYQNAGWAAGDYSEPDLEFGGADDFEFVYPFALTDGNFAKGEYVVDIKRIIAKDGKKAVSETYSYTYKYDVDVVVGKIISSVDYGSSVLTVLDDTDYHVTHNSISVYPQAKDVNMVVQFPHGLNKEPVETDEDSIVIGSPIYSGSYLAALFATVVYVFDVVQGVTVFSITLPVSGSFIIKVKQNKFIEGYINCVLAIEGKYEEVKGFNANEADRYLKIRQELDFYWGLYNMLLKANMDASIAIDKFKEILGKNGCVEKVIKDPQLIVPIHGYVKSGGGGTSWYNGTEQPIKEIGKNGDYYLQKNGVVYYKTDGEWVVYLSLVYDPSTSIVNIKKDYNVREDDCLVVVDSVRYSIDVVLPEAKSGTTKKSVYLKRKVNPVVIKALGGSKISGLDSFEIGTEGDTIDLVVVDNNWEIV